MHGLVYASRISDIANDARDWQVLKCVAQRLFDLVHRKFTLLEQHQHGRLVVGNLSAQFRADGPARTGDHDYFVGDKFMQPGIVENDRLAFHQIFNRNSPDFLR